MSIARLTDSIRRAGEGINEPRRLLLSDLAENYGAPPPSTIRRIVRDWTDDGVELAGHRVRTEKAEGRLFLVIHPHGQEVERPKKPVISVPLYHQFGRVVSY
jgi:hypothetical protein